MVTRASASESQKFLVMEIHHSSDCMMVVLHWELRRVCNSAATLMMEQAYLGASLLLHNGKGLEKQP